MNVSAIIMRLQFYASKFEVILLLKYTFYNIEKEIINIPFQYYKND